MERTKQKVRKHDGEVIKIFDGTRDTKTHAFTLHSSGFDFRLGQEVKLYADTPSKKDGWRFFSLASSPTTKGEVLLTLKHEDGAFTPYFLNQARMGDTYAIEVTYVGTVTAELVSSV